MLSASLDQTLWIGHHFQKIDDTKQLSAAAVLPDHAIPQFNMPKTLLNDHPGLLLCQSYKFLSLIFPKNTKYASKISSNKLVS
jgi:hypothetical protein